MAVILLCLSCSAFATTGSPEHISVHMSAMMCSTSASQHRFEARFDCFTGMLPRYLMRSFFMSLLLTEGFLRALALPLDASRHDSPSSSCSAPTARTPKP